MPEEPLETTELQEKLDEAIERAEKGAEKRLAPAWSTFLSLSTAVIAVLAALASLQAGSLANRAILVKNDAVLHQAKASDQWAYYQAKGIKGLFTKEERYKVEQAEIKKSAEELEKKVEEYNEQAERLIENHHHFAIAVTFFQVAIALSAIAAMLKKKPLWWTGLAIAACGVVFFVQGIIASR